jgi:methyl-accepting chemotaxis protein
MDLENAIKKHAEWKVKFRSAIATPEHMDAATISKDDCCELGKWLHGEAKTRFGKLASHGECVRKHAAFHIEAGKVAAAINAKKFGEAEAMINISSVYTAASNAVGVAIVHLKKEAGM